MRVQRACLQVHRRVALVEHAVFGHQHHQVGAQAGLVALGGQVVRGFGGGLGLGLLGLLAGHRAHRADLVGGLVHGFDDGGVVGLHGGVELGRLRAQVGAQAAGVEDRQVDGGADAVLFTARAQQPVEAHRRQADEGTEVEVGIERGLGRLRIAAGRFDAPTRGRDVGAPAQQIRRQRGRQGGQLHRAQRRTQAVERVGRLAGQRRQRVARPRHLLVDLLDLQARFGQRAFTLAQLHAGVQAALHALADDLQRLVALLQRALVDFALGLQATQLHIAAHDTGGQHHAGGLGLGLRRALRAQGRRQRGAVQTEEVEFQNRADLRRSQGADRTAQRRRVDAVGAEALAGDIGRTEDQRTGAGLLRRDTGLGARDAGLRHLQARVAGESALDQRSQVGVTEVLPPVGGQRRRCWRKGRVRQPQLRRLQGRRRRADAGTAGAATQHEHHARCEGQCERGQQLQRCSGAQVPGAGRRLSRPRYLLWLHLLGQLIARAKWRPDRAGAQGARPAVQGLLRRASPVSSMRCR